MTTQETVEGTVALTAETENAAREADQTHVKEDIGGHDLDLTTVSTPEEDLIPEREETTTIVEKTTVIVLYHSNLVKYSREGL